jgi:membrane protein DedA with SNARE-associated domain/rhodanese-related sulfurtransferase
MNYYLIHTTYPILFVAVFARQLCIPVPALLFLLSAGALSASGKLSYSGILAMAILGCVLADLIWFEAGRRRGKQVLRLLCALASDPSLCIRKARTAFAGKGLPLLLIAKFIPGLDGLCPPLAGMSGAPRAKFVAYDMGGAALWAGAYTGCGFLFAKELDRVARYTSTLANAFVLIFGIPLLLLFIWKLFLLLRMVRLLRSTQITAQALKERLDSGERIGIIDLQQFEDDLREITAIPGAVRLDPQDLRRKKRIVVPDDTVLVLYCRSKNNFVSARVGVTMRKHGIHHICVLAGGLAAWESGGFPVASQFVAPEAELARLGIQVTPPWNWTKGPVLSAE